MIKLKNLVMEDYNKKYYYDFVRYGDINPVKQHGYDAKDSDPGYHTPPVKYGFYAFPYDLIETFLITKNAIGQDASKIDTRRYSFLRDAEGNKVKLYKKDNDKRKGEYSDYVNKYLKKYFDHDDGYFYKKGLSEFPLLNSNGEYLNSYIIIQKPPKRFRYYGNLWHHLKEYMNKKTFILNERGGWVLTDMEIYLNALKRAKVDKIKHNYSKDHFEVFIERL